jgi:hypothetical protein
MRPYATSVQPLTQILAGRETTKARQRRKMKSGARKRMTERKGRRMETRRPAKMTQVTL